MLSKYGFQKIANYDSFTDDSGIDTIFFPVTDEPEFPEEIRIKAENLIDNLLEEYQTEQGRNPVCEQIELSANVEIYFQKRVPCYHLQVGIIDFAYEISHWTEYIIDTDDALYQPFRGYMLQQLEKSLFQ